MSTPEAVSEDYRALREAAGAVELARDVLRVAGPQAVEYLQGQLSQDVDALAPGDSALSLLLEPQGKVDALLRVTRLGHEDMLLDVDGGSGEAVLARLRRFKLRTKVDIELLAGWRCLAVRGPEARGFSASDLGSEVVTTFGWPGLAGVDGLGPDPAPPPGVRLCGISAYEAVRIEAGLPRMGAELDERTIPEEAGVVAAAASFTKGCYTGQELVARIDSRGGNVARRLRGVVLVQGRGAQGSGGGAPGEPPGPLGAEALVGAKLWVDGAEAGQITSAAWSPRLGPIALAYVRRRFEAPFDADVGSSPPDDRDGSDAGGRSDPARAAAEAAVRAKVCALPMTAP